jgi:hypothetical protein
MTILQGFLDCGRTSYSGEWYSQLLSEIVGRLDGWKRIIWLSCLGSQPDFWLLSTQIDRHCPRLHPLCTISISFVHFSFHCEAGVELPNTTQGTCADSVSSEIGKWDVLNRKQRLKCMSPSDIASHHYRHTSRSSAFPASSSLVQTWTTHLYQFYIRSISA